MQGGECIGAAEGIPRFPASSARSLTPPPSTDISVADIVHAHSRVLVFRRLAKARVGSWLELAVRSRIWRATKRRLAGGTHPLPLSARIALTMQTRKETKAYTGVVQARSRLGLVGLARRKRSCKCLSQ